MSSISETPFSKRLQNKREERGLSQSELARKAGLQPSAIAHFEAGRRKPSFINIRELAKALKTSADFLLGTEQNSATAFRNEENLTDRDREHIQGIIDMMAEKDEKN